MAQAYCRSRDFGAVDVVRSDASRSTDPLPRRILRSGNPCRTASGSWSCSRGSPLSPGRRLHRVNVMLPLEPLDRLSSLLLAVLPLLTELTNTIIGFLAHYQIFPVAVLQRISKGCRLKLVPGTSFATRRPTLRRPVGIWFSRNNLVIAAISPRPTTASAQRNTAMQCPAIARPTLRQAHASRRPSNVHRPWHEAAREPRWRVASRGSKSARNERSWAGRNSRNQFFGHRGLGTAVVCIGMAWSGRPLFRVCYPVTLVLGIRVVAFV
jgi:hypothetical protein